MLISDNLDDSCRRILEEAGIKVVTKTGLTKEQLQDEIKVKLQHNCVKRIMLIF